MLGMVIRQNICQPVTPSSRAASTMSSGIALIAADSTTIAKPAWIQISTTIRKRVFSGCVEQELLRLAAEPDEDLVEQADLLALRPGGTRRRTSR